MSEMAAPKLHSAGVPKGLHDNIASPINWTPLIPLLGEADDGGSVELSKAMHVITRHRAHMRYERGLVAEATVRRMIELDEQYKLRFELSTFGMTIKYIRRGQRQGKRRFESAPCSTTERMI